MRLSTNCQTKKFNWKLASKVHNITRPQLMSNNHPLTYLQIHCARTLCYCWPRPPHCYLLGNRPHDYQHHQQNYPQNSVCLCLYSCMRGHNSGFVACNFQGRGIECSMVEGLEVGPEYRGLPLTQSQHPLNSSLRNLKNKKSVIYK